MTATRLQRLLNDEFMALLAEDRRAFIANPWRLLDAFVIVTMALAMLPVTADALGASPALRLVRFVRLAVLGTRSGARLADVRGDVTGQADAQPTALAAHSLRQDDAGAARLEPIDWERALEQVGSDAEDWLYISGVDAGHLEPPIATRLQVPERVLQGKLFEAAFPRIDRMQHYVTLFAWYPELVPGAETVTLQRTGVLLVGSAQNVVVLARRPSDLLERLQQRLAAPEPGLPHLVQATHALVKEIIRAYLRATEHLEMRMARIEANEPGLRDRAFLAETFQLRSDISRVRTTLRHLGGVVRHLHSRRVAIHGFDGQDLPAFQLLAGEAEDLFERIDYLSESLTALVDMRLNVSSFQMNRVMRLLAILTTLALIPAVAGGMLGMNLSDTPWGSSLPEVGFWVGSGMLLSLYLFAVKGWLR